MRNILLLLLCAFPLSLSAALLNMIALEKASLPDKADFSAQLLEDWNLTLDTNAISLSDRTISFSLEDETISIMLMDLAIPWKEIQEACKYSFTWKEASAEMKKHQAHLIVSVISSNSSRVDREVLLNQVVVSMLKLTASIGVYVGRADLVRSRKEFIYEGMRIKQNALPVGNWLFFGLANTKKGNAGFTIGLKDFGYKEFEILESTKSLRDIHALFYNTSHYVINQDIVFKNKGTLGYTKTQKLPIRIKKSIFKKQKKVVLIEY